LFVDLVIGKIVKNYLVDNPTSLL